MQRFTPSGPDLELGWPRDNRAALTCSRTAADHNEGAS